MSSSLLSRWVNLHQEHAAALSELLYHITFGLVGPAVLSLFALLPQVCIFQYFHIERP